MPKILPALPPAKPEDVRASLRRTAACCAEVERLLAELGQLATMLENEMVGLGSEVGRLNAALASHRRAGGAA